MEIWRNFVLVSSGNVILLQVMRCELLIDRLFTSQRVQAGWLKVNHQQLLFIEVTLGQKIYFVYSLNQMVLFLHMVLMKTYTYKLHLVYRKLSQVCCQRISGSIRTKGIKLLHENILPHYHSDVIINYLTEEGINIILHLPYSSDLGPCDCQIIGYIKRNLTDQSNEQSLTRTVCKEVKNIPEDAFKNKLLTSF